MNETVLDSPPPLKLNLGGGTGPELPGYEVVDRTVGKEIFPLDYPDESVDLVRASHCLEHLSHRDVMAALADWVRVLKPGGMLKVAVPNFQLLCERQASGIADPLFEAYVMGGQTDENDFHASLFTERKLRNAMYLAGLRKIRHWESDTKDCSAYDISLNLCGVKPIRVTPKGVHAAMSVPRYGPTATHDCINRTLRQAGNIPLRMAWGAYWSEALTGVIEEILADEAEPAKYILFIDFDSVFTTDDVCELYRLIESTPEVDGVCALQIGRGCNKALMVAADENGKRTSRVHADWLQQDLARIESGHFGLTLVKADVFRQLKRPWFQAIPDENGGWRGKSYVAADVRFWREFTAQGFKLFSANNVPIAHLQEVLLWPDRGLAVTTQEVGEWRRQGPPPEVWR